MATTTSSAPQPASPTSSAPSFFPGSGEMPARCRSLDWSRTPLGPVESWPGSLRTVVSVVLETGFPSIVLWGPELVQIYNDGYIPFLGVKHPAGLGMPSHECWPEVKHLTEPIYERVHRGETVTNQEQLYKLKRNGPDAPADDVYITLSFSPVRGESGEVAGVFVTLMDTTAQVELRRAQAEKERLVAEVELSSQRTELERERFLSVILRTPAPVALLMGPDHRYEIVNEEYIRVTGGRDVTGMTPATAFPELIGSSLFDRFDEVYDTGTRWTGTEILVQFDRDGTGIGDHWFDLCLEPMRDASGTVLGILEFAVEVTHQVMARKQVEALLDESEAARVALSAARKEAEAASRAKSEFLAVMSHELRTPLNAIDGYAELLELGIRGPVTDLQRQDLNRIRTSQRHLLGLINGVLNYSRIEAGAVTYKAEPVPMDAVLANCETLTSPQVNAKGLEMHLRDCDNGLVAFADHEKVQQVVLNLISNAIKFTERGGQITLACHLDGADKVTLTVEDTGLGIPPDSHESIFQPFVQLDARLTRTHEGTGLGLAISRDLARGMGGDLTVRSVSSGGSRFSLTLPAAP